MMKAYTAVEERLYAYAAETMYIQKERCGSERKKKSMVWERLRIYLASC